MNKTKTFLIGCQWKSSAAPWHEKMLKGDPLPSRSSEKVGAITGEMSRSDTIACGVLRLLPSNNFLTLRVTTGPDPAAPHWSEGVKRRGSLGSAQYGTALVSHGASALATNLGKSSVDEPRPEKLTTSGDWTRGTYQAGLSLSWPDSAGIAIGARSKLYQSGTTLKVVSADKFRRTITAQVAVARPA
ncbi:hypothetical protein PAXRUDRAFT_618723 [Paxillus rubicundulus Ve08.2h10]|uniref:Uncharacterized protein n=1 Tax=Paxillus rubicundulus Ve08.2h10 TaxID=930991 RepID=A0A0D0DKC6_9AGAM|nr:hypothetical protein PAXRUDRAFT_618723 [Paxillus rubicundulus Ve08.2h10]